jgi:hypothetical protein
VFKVNRKFLAAGAFLAGGLLADGVAPAVAGGVEAAAVSPAIHGSLIWHVQFGRNCECVNYYFLGSHTFESVIGDLDDGGTWTTIGSKL